MKKVIGFYTLGLPFDGRTVYERSLGGSETALFYMAFHLARLGNEVHVFCRCPKPGVYENGVRYYDVRSFNEMVGLLDFDVFIVSRFFQFLATNFKSKFNILWNHDVPVNPNELMANIWSMDRMFCLSDYHCKLYTDTLPLLAPFVWKTQNGIDLRMVKAAVQKAPEKDWNKLIYAARPERGLLLLLEKIMPRLWQMNPNLKLYVAGYDLGNFPVDPRIDALYKHLDDLMFQMRDRVIQLGTLRKEDYYKHLASSALYIYPTDFPEISCISAMEAMACGIPFITTDDFALSETVPIPDYKVKGQSNSEAYQDAFVKRVLDFLDRSGQGRMRYNTLTAQAREYVVQHYEWANVAKDWDIRFDQFFQERLDREARRICDRLIYNSDLMAALSLAQSRGWEDTETLLKTKIAEIQSRSPDAYDKDDAHYLIHEKEIRFEQLNRLRLPFQWAKGCKTAVDLGCHYGEFAIGLVNTNPELERVVAVDFSSSCIEKGKQAASIKCDAPQKIEWITSSWDTFQPNEKFDLVFAGELIEHTDNPTAFIDRIEAFAKDGGRIILTIPSGAWEGGHKKPWSDRWHLIHFEYPDIIALFGQKLGFQVQFFPAGISPRGDLLGNFLVTYFKSADRKTGSIDYEHKWLVTRPYQTISACLIAKNEETNIARCLKSFNAVVDEIIVNDTGSSDHTIEIARSLGAKVLQNAWEEDFSIARNQSKEPASGDWIFWIDCDEELSGAHLMRKYIDSVIFEGFVIRQHHLCLDMQTKPDVPVRLFRNRPYYQFVGVVHEHCEDISKGKWDHPIFPTLILPDVNIIHYGYTSEYVRRIKCAERNLALLLKDRKKNPGRKLGLVLLQRDYINLTHWESEYLHGALNDKIIRYLRESIRIYRENFTDPKNVYHPLSDPLYQHALEILGTHGVPVTEGQADIPFEIALTLGGSVGGMQLPPDQPVKPMRRWFSTRQELVDYLNFKGNELAMALHLPEDMKDAIQNRTS